MTLRLFVCAAVVCSLQLSAQSAADAVFQVRYFADLNTADSVINLTTSCGFIQTNGSGFGIGKSCRIGGK